MFHDFFAGNPLLHLPLLALGIFFLFFVGVIAWVIFGMGGREAVRRIADLPLREDATADAAALDGREGDHE